MATSEPVKSVLKRAGTTRPKERQTVTGKTASRVSFEEQGGVVSDIQSGEEEDDLTM